MTKIIVRLVFWGLLVWGVYTETGIWTALAVGLIGISIEALQFQFDLIYRNRDVVSEALHKAWGPNRYE